MDKIILVICLLALIPLAILGRRFRMKYRNTKTLLIIQFCWFLTAVSFFLLGTQFNRAQNIIMGAFAGGGLVYFFYEFRAKKQNSDRS